MWLLPGVSSSGDRLLNSTKYGKGAKLKPWGLLDILNNPSLLTPDPLQIKKARSRWRERLKAAGCLNQIIYGLVREFVPQTFRPINGLKFGQYISVAYDLDAHKPVYITRYINDSMKAKAAETKVTKFPKDFISQMFDGFEFLGAVGDDAVLLLAQVGASSHSELGRFVTAYEEAAVLTYEDGKFEPRTLEEAATKAGLTYPRLLGLLSEVSAEYGGNLNRIVLHTSMPRVVKRLVQDATNEDGPNFKAQELLMKASGMIQTGPNVQINNNQQVNQLMPQAQLPELNFSLDVDAVNHQLPQGDMKQLESGEGHFNNFIDAVDAETESETIKEIIK